MIEAMIEPLHYLLASGKELVCSLTSTLHNRTRLLSWLFSLGHFDFLFSSSLIVRLTRAGHILTVSAILEFSVKRNTRQANTFRDDWSSPLRIVALLAPLLPMSSREILLVWPDSVVGWRIFMIKRFPKSLCKLRSRLLAVTLALTLLCAAMPIARTRADNPPSPISKLSLALQQALNSNVSQVWQDPARQTVRALIQSNGPVTSSLTRAITSAGGLVVRQFSSINGILVDLPKNSLLTIAARSDVERMSADHLAQQSSSHLEVATGADRARTYGLDGSGVGIAILDSGIMASHSEFGNLGNLLGLSRVTAKTDIASSKVN